MKLTTLNKIELEKMRRAGHLAASLLDHLTPHVKPGISTEKLDQIAVDFIAEHNAIAAPLNYRGFPKSICTSINDVVCHGIPSEDDILKDGDIINIDVTVIVDGFHGDTSRMFLVGDNVSDEARKLVQDTYDAMMIGIKTVSSGSYLHEIGAAIDDFISPKGYGLVREYCGHGIHKVFHDEPMVVHYKSEDPNYNRVRLKKGLCFTVEPMVNIGGWQTELLSDDWTVKTLDRTLSAQFEHTMAVTMDGVEIFTESPKGWHCPPYK